MSFLYYLVVRQEGFLSALRLTQFSDDTHKYVHTFAVLPCSVCPFRMGRIYTVPIETLNVV